MPKINVYLPDDLADAVKDTGVPVSAVCQRALEQAVHRVNAIRRATLGDLAGDDLADRFPQFTGRARTVMKRAIDGASTGGSPYLDSGHLLAGLVDEGDNLALRVLRAIDVDPALARRDLARHETTEPGANSSRGAPPAGAQPVSGAPPAGGQPVSGAPPAGGPGSSGVAAASGRTPSRPVGDLSVSGAGQTEEPAWTDPGSPEGGRGRARAFSAPAAAVLELAVGEATSLGHNYVGCEHLLLGMVGEPDGTAGQVLRALGAEPKLVRRAVTAALAGYVHLRAQTGALASTVAATPADPMAALAAAVGEQLRPLVARIERLEQQLAPGGER